VLRRLKGIGRWTAQVYLLFALGRPDIWPDGDLALQLAVQRLKQLPQRPSQPRSRRWARAGGHGARSQPACSGNPICIGSAG